MRKKGEQASGKAESTAGETRTRKAAKPRAKRETKPAGRPTKFTQALADQICELLASGMSMRTVCREERMPSMSTIFKWLRENERFSQQYTKAKAEAADALVEEMLDIADDGTNDWMERNGKDAEGYQLNGEHVQRSRLRVETRKWIAAKLKPKKYGEKVDVNHGVQPDNPLVALMQQVAGKTLKPVEEPEGS